MSVQATHNNAHLDWSTLLGKLDAASKAAGAQAAGGVTAGQNVTITATVEGAEKAITFPVPDDLDLPSQVDQAGIDSLCAKLAADKSLGLSEKDVEAVHAAFTGMLAAAAPAVSATLSSGSKSVLFDLYKLMALLVEVGQKQRDATRELRTAQSLQIQKSIQDQANQQRDAALTGMIAGAICCAIQVVVSCVMIAKQGGAFKKQIDTLESSGVSSAKQNLSMMEAADSPKAAQTQLEKAQSAVGNKPAGTEPPMTIEEDVKRGFNGSQNADSGAVKNYNDAKQQLEADTAKLQRLSNEHAELQEGDVPAGSDMAKAKAALAEFDAKKARAGELEALGDNRTPEQNQELDTLRGELQGKNRETLVQNVKDGRKALADQTKVAIETDKRNVESTRVAYREAVKADLENYETKYHSALSERALAENPTKEQSAALDAKVQLAADKLRYARAFANDRLAQPDVTTAQERAFDLHNASKQVGSAEKGRQLETGFLRASRSLQVGEAQLGIVNAIGGAAQSFVSGLSTYMQARTKESEAEQTRKQEELDQTKDLFNQAQNLVDAVVKLMQAVSSAETQSMRDAIQA